MWVEEARRRQNFLRLIPSIQVVWYTSIVNNPSGNPITISKSTYLYNKLIIFTISAKKWWKKLVISIFFYLKFIWKLYFWTNWDFQTSYDLRYYSLIHRFQYCYSRHITSYLHFSWHMYTNPVTIFNHGCRTNGNVPTDTVHSCVRERKHCKIWTIMYEHSQRRYFCWFTCPPNSTNLDHVAPARARPLP